ncbi:MAG: response regulator transcription factor [Rikenellaceae bacterium]|nr:response regulator transcription factor [Rikenellaceae bacterium]MCL2692058.1 response regulator transcription factor [Rikenellaceae bacterium]
MTAKKHKVLLVDDHTLFRRGLRGLLESQGLAEIVGEASDGVEFLEILPASGAQIVLLDIDMPRMGGAEAAAKALEAYHDLRIITLSMHGDEHYYFSMVSAGVKGFLLKSSEIAEVATAIDTVGRGGTYFSQELLQGLVGILRTSSRQREETADSLSERELEILLLICRGLSNHEIADALFISKRTVDKHRANIMSKTDTKNTANLVVWAIKKGMVEI